MDVPEAPRPASSPVATPWMRRTRCIRERNGPQVPKESPASLIAPDSYFRNRLARSRLRAFLPALQPGKQRKIGVRRLEFGRVVLSASCKQEIHDWDNDAGRACTPGEITGRRPYLGSNGEFHEQSFEIANDFLLPIATSPVP